MKEKSQKYEAGFGECDIGSRLSELRKLSTQTIDFGTLFAEELSPSGNLDLHEVGENSFGKLLNALPIPSLLVDKSHAVIFANAACAKISPTYQTTLGAPISSLFPKEHDARNTQALLEEIFSERSSRTSEALLEIEKRRIWARSERSRCAKGWKRSCARLTSN
ncbi:MAG: hypothetical protein P8182_14540 [Deltaproteobacteria bacterium]